MHTEIQKLVGELESILGTEHISTAADDLELFAFDFSEQQLERPAAIARPGSTDEVAAIVRLAHRSTCAG
jgi:FAD/FMN-containing dehydrogenase